MELAWSTLVPHPAAITHRITEQLTEATSSTCSEKASNRGSHIIPPADSITGAILSKMCTTASHHQDQDKVQASKWINNSHDDDSIHHHLDEHNIIIQCPSDCDRRKNNKNSSDDDDDVNDSKQFSINSFPSFIIPLISATLKWRKSLKNPCQFSGSSTFNPLLITLLLFVTTSAAQDDGGRGVAVVGTRNTTTTSTTPHHCYVCLPPDKSSHEAREILGMFDSSNIPDCAAFGPHNAHQFEFPCPEKYVGCLRRALTTNPSLVSRTCVNLAIDDCKVANSVEYCYCSGDLCNGEKPARPIMSSAEKRDEDLENAGYWKEGITDDEDLLGPNSNHPEGSGDHGDASSSEHHDNGHAHPNNNDNSRNPLKPSNDNDSSSQESTTTFHQRKFYSGSNIPASSNKGTIRHTETIETESSNNNSVKANSNHNRAYAIIIIVSTVLTTAAFYNNHYDYCL